MKVRSDLYAGREAIGKRRDDERKIEPEFDVSTRERERERAFPFLPLFLAFSTRIEGLNLPCELLQPRQCGTEHIGSG